MERILESSFEKLDHQAMRESIRSVVGHINIDQVLPDLLLLLVELFRLV